MHGTNDGIISLLINIKMPTVVGIFLFISREIFMLSRVAHEKSFITSGPGHCDVVLTFTTNWQIQQTTN